jgi:hypothetical protein
MSDGDIEAGVERLAAWLAYPEGDPRLTMLDLARRLAVLMDLDDGFADSHPTGHYLPVRDLFEMCIAQASDCPNHPPGPADEIRARRLTREVGPILGDPAAESP